MISRRSIPEHATIMRIIFGTQSKGVESQLCTILKAGSEDERFTPPVDLNYFFVDNPKMAYFMQF